MNNYLARTICDDLKDNVRRFCSCHSVNWRSGCVATCIASLLPVSFILHMFAFIWDTWASATSDFHGMYIDYMRFGCGVIADQLDSRICGLSITVCSAEFLLVCFGLGVCVRSCMGSFDLQSCSFCYVCFIPTLSLLHGILGLTSCIITANFKFNNKQYDYTYGLSFYIFLFTGCTTVFVSLASVCGYICMKLLAVNQDYQYQLGSDDADGETMPVLHAGP